MARGEIVILAAPSGIGAGALLEQVPADGPGGPGALERPLIHTTRPPRESESDGRDYHFVDPRSFQRMIDENRLLEWSEYGGVRFGTAREEVTTRLERGRRVVLQTDLEGIERLRAACPGARTAVVLPAAVSPSERKRYDSYDCVIILDDLKRATGVLASFVLEGA